MFQEWLILCWGIENFTNQCKIIDSTGPQTGLTLHTKTCLKVFRFGSHSIKKESIIVNEFYINDKLSWRKLSNRDAKLVVFWRSSWRPLSISFCVNSIFSSICSPIEFIMHITCKRFFFPHFYRTIHNSCKVYYDAKIWLISRLKNWSSEYVNNGLHSVKLKRTIKKFIEITSYSNVS